jgi:hypothetical protein
MRWGWGSKAKFAMGSSGGGGRSATDGDAATEGVVSNEDEAARAKVSDAGINEAY